MTETGGALTRVRVLDRFSTLAALTTALTAGALVPILHLWNASLRIPFAYYGDANSGAEVIKGMLDHGWYERNPNLNAPFGQHLNDYPFADNLHLVVMKVIGTVFRLHGADYPLVLNVYYLLGFFLVALAMLWALRRLGVSPLVSVVVAVLYTFMPFHETRGEVHLFIGAYYVVPLACFLALRSLDPVPILRLDETNRPRWRRMLTTRNVGAVVICVLIGEAGSYVAAFTILLFALVVAMQLWRWVSWRRVVSTVLLTAVVAGTFAASRLPDVLYQRQHGVNPSALYRTVGDSEEYGLKLAAMLLPYEQHRIAKLRHFSMKFHAPSPIQGEAGQSLGLIGAAGLIVLLALVVLGLNRRRPGPALQDRLSELGRITVALILLATVSGLSGIIAIFATDLRAWNRISIFIAFFALLAVALLLDHARELPRLPTWIRRGWPALLVVLLVAGLFDQTWNPPSYEPAKIAYKSDDAFVKSIERALGARAMVFQLPYNQFPEGSKFVYGDYYDHLRGYLHSSTLRWSYGGVRGRPDADWQMHLEEKNPTDMLDTIAALGFDGIYVDRAGYKDHGAATEAIVQQASSGPPLVSANKRLALYDIRAYATALRARDPERAAALRAAVLDPAKSLH